MLIDMIGKRVWVAAPGNWGKLVNCRPRCTLTWIALCLESMWVKRQVCNVCKLFVGWRAVQIRPCVSAIRDKPIGASDETARINYYRWIQPHVPFCRLSRHINVASTTFWLSVVNHCNLGSTSLNRCRYSASMLVASRLTNDITKFRRPLSETRLGEVTGRVNLNGTRVKQVNIKKHHFLMPYRCSVFSHVSNDISSRRCGSRSWPILVNRSDFNGANSVPLERVWSFKYPLACSSSSCSHAYSTFGLSLGGPDETASADWVLCGPIVWFSLYTMVSRSPCPELVPSGLLFSIWVMPSGMNENLIDI